jgi:Ca2+-binding RTX toxin-like protein
MRGRLATVIVLAGALAMLSASVSYAGTVSVVAAPDPPFHPVAVFTAEPGETNQLDVTIFMVFTDTGAPLTAGDGCASLGPNSAFCFSANVDAYLRDGNDDARFIVNGIGRLFAGNGNDHVIADSFGSYTVVYGENGDDDIAANGEGGQIADGGPGDDIVRAGGFFGNSWGYGRGGSDTIYFSVATSGVGLLDGGDGPDTILAHPSGEQSTALGGNGDDTIVIQTTPPVVPGGSYFISGGNGDDTLVGGPFDDTIDGGNGSDSIDASDGGADTIACGAGNDVVHADATDTVASDCEVVLG